MKNEKIEIGVITKELIVKDGKPKIKQTVLYSSHYLMKSNVDTFEFRPLSPPIKFDGKIFNTSLPLRYF